MGGCRILFISSALLLSCALSSGQESSRVDTLAASVVTAQDNPASIHTGLVRLDRKMLSEAPAVLGSPDVIKVIQNLPGVSAGTELMSGLYVHGGDGSDNLFLLDGVPLYQVSHLGGLFFVQYRRHRLHRVLQKRLSCAVWRTAVISAGHNYI